MRSVRFMHWVSPGVSPEAQTKVGFAFGFYVTITFGLPNAGKIFVPQLK